MVEQLLEGATFEAPRPVTSRAIATERWLSRPRQDEAGTCTSLLRSSAHSLALLHDFV